MEKLFNLPNLEPRFKLLGHDCALTKETVDKYKLDKLPLSRIKKLIVVLDNDKDLHLMNKRVVMLKLPSINKETRCRVLYVNGHDMLMQATDSEIRLLAEEGEELFIELIHYSNEEIVEGEEPQIQDVYSVSFTVTNDTQTLLKSTPLNYKIYNSMTVEVGEKVKKSKKLKDSKEPKESKELEKEVAKAEKDMDKIEKEDNQIKEDLKEVKKQEDFIVKK